MACFMALLFANGIRYVRAYAADAIPLAGMRLLDRHYLNIEVVDGGRVVIQTKENSGRTPESTSPLPGLFRPMSPSKH